MVASWSFSGVAEARAVAFECQQQWRIACLSSYERDALKACCYLHLQLLWNLFRCSGAHASEMGGLRWEDMDLQEEPRRTPLEKINEKHYFMKKMTNQFPRSLDLNRGGLVMLLIQASQELLIQPSVLELIGDKLHQAKQ